MTNNDQLVEKVNNLSSKIDSVVKALNIMQKDINSRVRLSDLSSTETEFKSVLNSQGTTIVDIEKKLSKITLPEETRYYLTETEVGSFKSDFSKLKAMLAKFETLYKNLVSFSVSRAVGTA